MPQARDNNLKLYARHRPALVDYASSITGDSAYAEDVVQEAWLRIDRGANADLVKEPLRYLYRIVRNLAIDIRRHARRSPTDPVQAADLTELPICDDRPDQEAALIARSELAAVVNALAELPERTRTAIRLHRMEGRPLREVADALDISITRAHDLIAEGIAHCDRRRNATISARAPRKR